MYSQGNEDYSRSNYKTLLKYLNKNRQIEKSIYADKGFRTHHRYTDEEGRTESFLAYCLRNKLYNSLKGPAFTVDSISLLDQVEFNLFVHQVIFNDVVMLTRLRDSAGEVYGFPLQNETLIQSFLRAEYDSQERSKYVYKAARIYFGIEADQVYEPQVLFVD